MHMGISKYGSNQSADKFSEVTKFYDNKGPIDTAKSWLRTIRQGLTGFIDFILPGVGSRIESEIAKVHPDVKWKSQKDALNWVNGKLNQYTSDIEAKNQILQKLQQELDSLKSNVTTARNYKVQNPAESIEKVKQKVKTTTNDLTKLNNRLNNAYLAQSAAANTPNWSQSLSENFERLAGQIDKDEREEDQ